MQAFFVSGLSWFAARSYSVLSLEFLFSFLHSFHLARVLGNESGGYFRATKTTWLLSHLQAACGSVCAAAAGLAVCINFSASTSGTVNAHGFLLLIRIGGTHSI